MWTIINEIIIFGFCFIYQIGAIEINGKTFKFLKGIQANLNVTRVTDARSVVECAIHCRNAEGCSRANFRYSTCEILDVDPGRRDIELVEEHGSMYICKFCVSNLIVKT